MQLKTSANNSTVLKEKGNKIWFWTLIYLSVALGLRPAQLHVMTSVQYLSLACPLGTSLRPLWAPPPGHSQAGCCVESSPEVGPNPGCPFSVEGGLPGRQQLWFGGWSCAWSDATQGYDGTQRNYGTKWHVVPGRIWRACSHEVIFDVMVNTWTVEEKYVIQFGLTNSRGTLWGYASQRAGRMKLAMSVKEVKWSKWGWDWAKVKPVMQMEIDAMSVVKCLMMFFLPDN